MVERGIKKDYVRVSAVSKYYKVVNPNKYMYKKKVVFSSQKILREEKNIKENNFIMFDCFINFSKENHI